MAHRYMVFLWFGGFLFINSSYFAQKTKSNRTSDSLLVILNNAKEDTAKLNVLNALCLQYNTFEKNDSAILYGKQGMILAEKIISSSVDAISKVGKKGLGVACNRLGTIYRRIGNYSKAIDMYIKAKKVHEEIGYKKGIANSLYGIGTIYINQGNDFKALECFLLAKKICEEIGHRKGVVAIYTEIGGLYQKIGDYPKALESAFNAIKIAEEIGDKSGLATSLNNIGRIYAHQRDYIKALEYFNKALKIDEEIGYENQIAYSLGNIGSAYEDLKNYPKAIEKQLEALKLFEKVGNKLNAAGVLINIGNNYTHRGDHFKSTIVLSKELSRRNETKASCYKKAFEYYFKSLQILSQTQDENYKIYSYIGIGLLYLKQISLTPFDKHKIALQSRTYLLNALTLSKKRKEKNLVRDSYKNLYALDSIMGNWQAAFENHRQYIIYRDSLINEESTNKIIKTEMNYKFEKKEQEIISLTKEKEIQNLKLKQQQLQLKKRQTQITALIALILLVIVSVAFIYNRIKTKQKEMFNAERLKMQELRSLSALEAEEKERSRIAQDLHDGIGQLLSATKLNILALGKNFPKQDKEQSLLMDNIGLLVDESVKEIRSISHNLSPSMFGQSNLDGAINQFVEKVNAGGKLVIELQVVDLPSDINKGLSIAIYRIIQEAVNNVVKHAKATHATIQIIRHQNVLSLMIEDNGLGFDNSKTTQNKGMGLANIQSRISFWKGKVNIDSSPGNGTTLIIEVPIV